MKRKGTKFHSKKLKSHVPSNSHAYYFFKYDRNYVAAHYGDINHVPFSCGSRRMGFFCWYEHPNDRLWAYLNRYMVKQVGRKLDDVFHDFSMLGWKCTAEMYHYWTGFVGGRIRHYHADADGYMCAVPSSADASLFDDWDDDWDDWDEFDENDEYLMMYAQKPLSEKRLVRRHLHQSVLKKAS